MRILMATSFLENFTGSEVNIVEISKELISMGYTVDIVAFSIGSPLENELIKNKLNYNRIHSNLSLQYEYDIIWAQHWITIEYLLLQMDINYRKVIFSSLSPYESLEALPIFIDDISLCLANSYETKEQLLKEGLLEDKCRVFHNSIPNEYIKYNSIDNVFKNNPTQICVVSNHIPEEVRGLSRLPYLKFKVTFFGIDDEYKLISPELLSKYDAVITIGKTVQYALSMGIPVYCYDRFGGPGWIDSSNFNKSLYFNFSGRGFEKKLSTSEIYKELINGYPRAKAETMSYLKDVSIEEFSLRNQIEKVLTELNETQNNDIAYLNEKYSAYKRKSSEIFSLFIKKFNGSGFYKTKLLEDIRYSEDKLINYLRINLRGDSIFIWGGGKHTLRLLQLLNTYKVDFYNDIKYVIDSNPKLQGEYLNNIGIIHSEAFFTEYVDECSDIVISSYAYEKEIYDLLLLKLSSQEKTVNIIKIYDQKYPVNVLL